MHTKFDFFIAGKTRNKDNILRICDIFDKYNVSYYCFLKNDETMDSYGNADQTGEEKMEVFEKMNDANETNKIEIELNISLVLILTFV